MKKQEYIDLGLTAWLNLSQIESVLMQVLGITKEQLFKQIDISSRYIYEVQKIFYDLRSGASQEYVFEKADFYGRTLYVDNRVLIPRNDTEILVSTALEVINNNPDVQDTVYIDVWTWSGCIPISIVCEMYPLVFHSSYALDIMPAALGVAQKNINTYAAGQIEIRESDLLKEIFHDESLVQKDLFITANLPYIKNQDTKNMDENVVNNEPHSALFWGEKTWFELYERLIKQCFQIKQVQKIKNIHLIIEIGFDQSEYSMSYLQDMWLRFEYFKDTNSIYRVAHVYGF